ncbi:hypothetical protein Hanom_Chr13g01191591 [Helianthus anomalus]
MFNLLILPPLDYMYYTNTYKDTFLLTLAHCLTRVTRNGVSLNLFLEVDQLPRNLLKVTIISSLSIFSNLALSVYAFVTKSILFAES